MILKDARRTGVWRLSSASEKGAGQSSAPVSGAPNRAHDAPQRLKWPGGGTISQRAVNSGKSQ